MAGYFRLVSLFVLCLPLLIGCKTEYQQALLVSPTEAEKSEVNKQIAIALKASSVLLAKDAFQKQSFLVVERKRHQSIAQKHLDDRTHQLPDRFQLVKKGARCALIHLKGRAMSAPEREDIYPLKGVKCIPAQQP